MPDTRYSLSVKTTFGQDCLKEIKLCEEFPNEGNASDCQHHNILEFDFGSMTYTLFMEIGQNFSTLIYIN